MATRSRFSEQRLREILDRQDVSRWGREYVPSIRASRNEAPRSSWATRIFWPLHDRDLSFLSKAEVAVGLVALYANPLDLHEQKMISTEPREHPLVGMPAASGMALPPIRGSIDVLSRMGMSKHHPTISAVVAGKRLSVPFPYIGDQLLFLVDAAGAYCVNLNVKKEPGLHSQPFGTKAKHRASAQKRAELRFQMEQLYYLDAGIRTVAVSETEVHRHVRANLSDLYSWHCRKIEVAPDLRADLIAHFKEGLVSGLPARQTIMGFTLKYRIDPYLLRGVFYQAIWERDLRPDLHHPVVLDAALPIERLDVLEELSHWFRR